MSGTEIALMESEVEVVAKASRRRLTVAYKRKIVQKTDGCKTPGAVGALLRCAIGSWGGWCLSLGDYVTGPGATRGAGGAGGRSC